MAFGTEYIFIKGKLSWVRVVNLNQFGDWSATIHPDPESLEIIKDLLSKGLKNSLKKDGDGYYMQFKCPPTRKTKGGGSAPQTAPVVVDKEGKPFDGTTIGNGSDGYLKLEVYGFRQFAGIAARLVGLRIDNLVVWDGARDAAGSDGQKLEGLADQKEMLF